MSVARTRSLMYRSARLMGDYQAVRRGRVPQRIYNRLLGRVLGAVFRSLMR